jgi:hypothetical protein
MNLIIYEVMREENGWRREEVDERVVRGRRRPFKIEQERRDTRSRGM